MATVVSHWVNNGDGMVTVYAHSPRRILFAVVTSYDKLGTKDLADILEARASIVDSKAAALEAVRYAH